MFLLHDLKREGRVDLQVCSQNSSLHFVKSWEDNKSFYIYTLFKFYINIYLLI